MDLLRIASLLKALRCSGRQIPLGAAEALLLIASGVDSVPALAAAMGTFSQPLPPASVSRLVSMLRGRARFSRGGWVESPYRLIEVRQHPHQRGWQLLLSSEGETLISDCLSSANNRTNLLGSTVCASEEVLR